MGIEITRQRLGFVYYDAASVLKQFEQVKKDVFALKYHPVTTMIAGAEKRVLDSVPKYCPCFYFFSFQFLRSSC